MFLKEKRSGHLVEILALPDLFNPNHASVSGRLHYGEEMQEPEAVSKDELTFPSGEPLPRCWTDVHYRDVAGRH